MYDVNFDCNLQHIQYVKAENVLGVSESDMINYHSVFADSGNSGAQV